MRTASERHFSTHDGVALFYRHWPAHGGAANKAVVIFHRGHEHSGRLQPIVDELALDDYAMFAWDARGHGCSPGARGDSPGFAASVKDVDTFVRHISTAHDIPLENISVIGQSVGAVLVSAWVHDYAPAVRCLVLTAPAFKVKLYVPFARAGLNLLYKLRGNFFITSYIKAKFLTHDAERIRSYDTDPLITRHISVRILLGLYDAADRVVPDAQAITLPTQVLISGNDWVVHQGPQRRFYDNLGSTVKELVELPGFLHDTLGEKDRHLALEKIRGFIMRCHAAPVPAISLLDADQHGYTKAEAARNAEPLPALSLKNMQFALTRGSMRTLGRAADGISLGLATGFDSGATLDYVYRNQAHGTPPLGRLIDRNYLDAIGWRGIRVRKAHLEQAIAFAAGQLDTAHRKARILDIAAGHGRYVIDAVARLAAKPEAILLRDYSDANVRAGTALLAQAGLSNIAQFTTGDAFDEENLAAVTPAPTLAIASGIYELFSDNRKVLSSLRGLARAMDAGSYLIYTGQPWHPQLEFIARTLTSHRDGKAWVMRRRTQQELDQLVRHSGFTKVEQWIDEWGIFTVSVAVRTGQPDQTPGT
ncbi:MAG: bifunctional alpha/beta hydrolase/class I SAM-dependent methyltransferase [Burkholderiales bacterium]